MHFKDKHIIILGLVDDALVYWFCYLGSAQPKNILKTPDYLPVDICWKEQGDVIQGEIICNILSFIFHSVKNHKSVQETQMQ